MQLSMYCSMPLLFLVRTKLKSKLLSLGIIFSTLGVIVNDKLVFKRLKDTYGHIVLVPVKVQVQ